MITRFDPTAHPQNRSLSEILDLTVLAPKNHRVPRIDYRYVERTLVLAFDNNCCSVL